MGVTRVLGLRDRLPQCPGVHRGCPAAIATAGGALPWAARPGPPASARGRRGPARWERPSSPWGPRGVTPCGRVVKGSGVPACLAAAGGAGGRWPGGPPRALSFQAAGVRARRSQARTGGGAGLPPWAASRLQVSRGCSLRCPGVWWLAVGVIFGTADQKRIEAVEEGLTRRAGHHPGAWLVVKDSLLRFPTLETGGVTMPRWSSQGRTAPCKFITY